MRRAIHCKGSKHDRGFLFARTNRSRIAIFVERRQPEKVLPLRISKLVGVIFKYFFFASLHFVKIKSEPQIYKWFREQKYLLSVLQCH
jgi:hypothetical protein